MSAASAEHAGPPGWVVAGKPGYRVTAPGDSIVAHKL